jgi:dTDP-4-amino-4,6-dideoxygalactose transaminase
MNSPIPLFGIYRDAEMETIAAEVLRSGQIASGAYVKKFTDQFAQLIDNPHVVTMNDMSSAIQIALHLSGVGTNDEVLTTAFACMSTNGPIALTGGKPVWVDIDASTGLMDPNALRDSITSRSKAVIVYHVAGYPARIVEIAEICREFGLKLIEDCDNALLATVGGSQVGSFGDFSIFSFYPNRQINATEGGALVCRDVVDAERAVRLRRYGIDLSKFRDKEGEIDPLCDIPEIGWAATLNNLCSAVGYVQLNSVESRLAKTRENASILSNRLNGIEGLEIVSSNLDCVPSYWVLLVRVKKRDDVLSILKSRGIHASKLHQRTDRYTGFGVPKANLIGTKRFTDSVIGLPCGWWLSNQDIEIIISEVVNSLSFVTTV